MKKKILLADDDPALRRMLFRLLVHEDYTVNPVANGKEAIEAAAATNWDLVLLDLTQPADNGWETLEQLTAVNPHLPRILITSRSDQSFPQASSGIATLFEKPLDLPGLLKTISALLAESAKAGRLS